MTYGRPPKRNGRLVFCQVVVISSAMTGATSEIMRHGRTELFKGGACGDRDRGTATYFVCLRKPKSDVEPRQSRKGAQHLSATRVRSVNDTERVAHSPACPSRSRYSLAAGKRVNDDIEWLGVEIEQVIKPSNLAVAAMIFWKLYIH